jgi:enoyl-CoA hydratase/carnithine racemase
MQPGPPCGNPAGGSEGPKAGRAITLDLLHERHLPGEVIAHELVLGAGVALPLACDWRVMGESAYLYVPEVKIGLNLQWGALPRLVNLVGPSRAKRICILCEKMDARTALDWGLVDEVAADGQTVDVALELARTEDARNARDRFNKGR